MTSKISEDTVCANFMILPTFQVGDKPVSDPKGRITKEDREWLVTWRRKSGAFNIASIKNTFKRAVQMIEASCNPEKRKDFKVQATNEKCQELFENFLQALGGVERLSSTYEKERNQRTSKALSDISESNKKKYQLLADLINPKETHSYRGSSSPSSKSPPPPSDEVVIVLHYPNGTLEGCEAEPDSSEISSLKYPVIGSSSSSDDLQESFESSAWNFPAPVQPPANIPSEAPPAPSASPRKAPPKPSCPPPKIPPQRFAMEYLAEEEVGAVLRQRGGRHDKLRETPSKPRSVVYAVDDAPDSDEKITSERIKEVKKQCKLLNCIIS